MSNQAIIGQIAAPVIEDVINVTLYNPSKSQLGIINEKPHVHSHTIVTSKKVTQPSKPLTQVRDKTKELITTNGPKQKPQGPPGSIAKIPSN